MSSSTSSDERPTERRRRQRCLQVVLVVLAVTQVIWANMTDQQRRLAIMRLWSTTSRTAGRLGHLVGERELRAEAGGSRRPAYEVSLALSLVRDAAGRRYEALRYA